MTRTLANQWDDPPHLDNRLLVILLISFSIFCYKLSIFGNFILQNIEVDLYTETLKLALFWLQNGGWLIHRFDLYTGKYGAGHRYTTDIHVPLIYYRHGALIWYSIDMLPSTFNQYSDQHSIDMSADRSDRIVNNYRPSVNIIHSQHLLIALAGAEGLVCRKDLLDLQELQHWIFSKKNINWKF